MRAPAPTPASIAQNAAFQAVKRSVGIDERDMVTPDFTRHFHQAYKPGMTPEQAVEAFRR